MNGPSPHIDYAAITALDDYCARQVVGQNAARQCRALATRFLHWLELAGVGLADVTPPQVDDFLGTHDISPGTKTFYRTLLRRFFDALVACGLMQVNPIAAAKPRAVEPPAEAGAMNEDVEDENHTGPTPIAELTAFPHDLGISDEGDEFFRPGLVAMYPIIVGGMDAREITATTGIALAEVELYIGRLRENGIWTPDGKFVIDFDDPQSAEAIVNLVYIIGCAKGIFVRVPAPDQGRDDQAAAAEAPAPPENITPPLRVPRPGWTEERRRRHSEQMKAYWQRRQAGETATEEGG